MLTAPMARHGFVVNRAESWARPRGWVGIPVIALTMLFAGCEEPVEEAPPPLRPVRSVVAQPASGGVTNAIAGVTRASTESRLSFRVGGSLSSVRVTVGERVGRGAVLAELDPADLEIQVEQTEASLAQVIALERQSRAEYERVRALYENNNASKSDLDAARAAAESATAQVEAARKALEQAQRQLGYSTLVAPTAGAVASVDAEENETVAAGQTIVVLESGARPEIELAVSEVTIPYLEVGDSVEIEIAAAASGRLKGKVSEVGVAATPGASTFPAIVSIENAPSTVRSGMAAEVYVTVDRREDGVVVPFVSVGEDGQGRYVFVVEAADSESAVVERRSVEVAGVDQDGIVVTSGLQAGERVVTAGTRRLTSGMRVKNDFSSES